MGVGSGRARVADLVFQVHNRTLHPEWFSVRARRRYVQAGWEADLLLIEGGHVVLWSCGSVRITEVLAGPDTPLPDSGLIFQSPVRQERSKELRPGHETEYQTCFAAERIDDQVFAHLNDELRLDGDRKGLFCTEAAPNRWATPPLSRLFVEIRPRGLSAQAFHTFPEERAIVRTQSLFEFRS